MNWLDIITEHFRKEEIPASKPALKAPAPRIEPVITQARTRAGRTKAARRRISRDENVSKSARSHR